MQGYKRVDGPSEDELKKKYEEGRKNSPFSNPSRKSPSSACLGQKGHQCPLPPDLCRWIGLGSQKTGLHWSELRVNPRHDQTNSQCQDARGQLQQHQTPQRHPLFTED